MCLPSAAALPQAGNSQEGKSVFHSCITPSHLELSPVLILSLGHWPGFPALAPASSRHEDSSLLAQVFTSNRCSWLQPSPELEQEPPAVLACSTCVPLGRTERPCLLRAVVSEVHGNLGNHPFLPSFFIPLLQWGNNIPRISGQIRGSPLSCLA